MRHFIVLALGLCVVLPAYGQLEDLSRRIADGNCEAAAADCRTYLSDERLRLVAAWGLAAAYSDTACTLYNPAEAYTWLEQFYPEYRKLDDREKERLDRKGIGSTGKLRNRISDALYARALATGDPAVLDSFGRHYPLLRSSLHDDARKAALRLRTRLLIQTGGPADAWAQLQKNYAEWLPGLPGLRDTIDRGLLAAWLQSRGWDAWPDFRRAYPENRYGADRTLPAFLTVRKQAAAAGYRQFADRNPSSAWAPIARDSAQVITQRQQWRQAALNLALDTLSRASDPAAWSRADQQLTRGFISDIINQPAAASRLAAIPGQRAPLTLDTLANRYRAAGQLELFLSKFPLYAQKDAIEKELEAVIAQREEAERRRLAAKEAAERRRQAQIERQRIESDSLRNAYLQKNRPRCANQSRPVHLGVAKSKLLAYQQLVRKLSAYLEARNWPVALAEARLHNADLAGFAYYDELVAMLSDTTADPPLTLLGGEVVNTNDDEYTPVLSADGKQLYFCRAIGGEERVYQARLTPNGWVDQGMIRGFQEGRLNTAPLALSGDGNQILLFKNGQMFYAGRRLEGWSTPASYPPAINGGPWQGMGALSPDGKVMIFEVTGWPGQEGARDVDFDLYISFQLPDGSWTPGQSLSPVINTAGMERSPFLHPDMRTLYFSTNARGGLGQMDVYKTTRIGDDWFCWSEPVHLGRAVNTSGHDWGYKVTTDGRYAYFAGNARSSAKSEQNIYQVELPQAARPDPVTLIETRILTPDGKPLDGVLQVEDLETGKTIMELRTEPGTGRVTAPLPNNRRYALVFEDGRRLPLSNTLDLSKVDSSQTVTQDVVLKAVEELKAGEGLVLNNIFFDYGEAILKPESQAEIRRAAEFLKNTPDTMVEIAGHTDNTSSREFNLSLSTRRAESVRNALIQQGISPERLSAQGYGPDQPVAPNDTEEGRAANRRVEMKWK